MRLMRITLDLAFEDVYDADLDTVRGDLVRCALNGLYAEVATTRAAEVRDIEYPDTDMEVPDSFDAWQDEARERMETAFNASTEGL